MSLRTAARSFVEHHKDASIIFVCSKLYLNYQKKEKDKNRERGSRRRLEAPFQHCKSSKKGNTNRTNAGLYTCMSFPPTKIIFMHQMIIC